MTAWNIAMAAGRLVDAAIDRLDRAFGMPAAPRIWPGDEQPHKHLEDHRDCK